MVELKMYSTNVMSVVIKWKENEKNDKTQDN